MKKASIVLLLVVFLVFCFCFSYDRKTELTLEAEQTFTVFLPENNRVIFDLRSKEKTITLFGNLTPFPTIQRIAFDGLSDQISLGDQDGDGIPEFKFVTKEVDGESLSSVYKLEVIYLKVL